MCVLCSQLSYLKQELNHLQTKLGEEQQLASQHQLALQAQVNEGQARIKVCMIITTCPNSHAVSVVQFNSIYL